MRVEKERGERLRDVQERDKGCTTERLEEGRRVSLPMSLPEKPFLEEGERDLRKFDRWKWVLVSEW